VITPVFCFATICNPTVIVPKRANELQPFKKNQGIMESTFAGVISMRLLKKEKTK
jgi:hypothetical protein